jgi:hypothetical protein
VIELLDIPQPFDIVQFCARLERQRGRPIQLVQIATTPGAPCGMWVPTAASDYILHDGITPIHRQHNILHEIGHMILGHRGGSAGARIIGQLVPDLDPMLVESQLGSIIRTSCEKRAIEGVDVKEGELEEEEAEIFADLVSLIPAEQEPLPAISGRDLPSDAAEVISRIESSLSGGCGGSRARDRKRYAGYRVG